MGKPDRLKPIARFSGTDTLCLAIFFEYIVGFGIAKNDVSIFVEGRDNITLRQTRISGKFLDVHKDGYIRNIVLSCNDDIYDVGGTNATQERIAGKSIDVVFDYDTYRELIKSDVGRCVINYNPDNLVSLMDYKACLVIPEKVSIAKSLKNEAVIKDLIETMHSNVSPCEIEVVCESFRCMWDICQSKESISKDIVIALCYYIKNNINCSERALSVVYAVEALQYVAYSNRCVEHVIDFLKSLLRIDKNVYIHRHLEWSINVCINELNKKLSCWL